MASYTNNIQITSKSKATVFAGNLLKAPPLNRRGRKKWHERYFVLRANKTFECYKSRKAAETSKSPRRTIDLRECINLEVGLEYKSLQHILSLGTFKRAFFVAAPSDALMLQWANVLEKVKNAQEGESIEILDIGLRKSRDHNAVHRVKPSTSMHRFSIGSPQKTHFYSTGASKSTMALSHFTTESSETINLRESQDSTAFLISPPLQLNLLSKNESTDRQGEEGRAVRVSVTMKQESPTESKKVWASPKKVANGNTPTLSGVDHPISSSPPGSSPRDQVDFDDRQGGIALTRLKAGYIPTRIPPPTLTTKSKTGPKKPGPAVIVVGAAKEGQDDGGSPRRGRKFSSKDEEGAGGSPTRGRKFSSKKDQDEGGAGGSPTRGRKFSSKKDQSAGDSPTRGRKFSSKKDQDEGGAGGSPTRGRKFSSKDEGGAGGSLSRGQKEFASKEGSLQRSKAFRSPVHSPRGKQNSDNKREEDSFESDGATILHSNMKRSVRYRKITLKHEKPIFADRQDGDNSSDEEDSESRSPSSVFINDEHTNKVGPNFAMEQSQQVQRSTKTNSKDQVPPRVLCRVRSNSYSKIVVGGMKGQEHIRNSGVSGPKLTKIRTVEGKKKEEKEDVAGMQEITPPASPPPASTPPSSPHFLLPERPRDSLLFRSTNSLNSLDNLLVDPPEMFDTKSGVEKISEQTGSGANMQNGGLEQEAQNEETVITDRNSTESNDTGYTSSASPGFQERNKLSTPEPDKQTGTSLQQNGNMERSQSQMSTKSEIVKHYIPLVFRASDVGGDFSIFALQICLVENTEELIKDLVALKTLENFSLIECEEEQNSNVASLGDDFTVETSLEDLEFGFSVITSTQKDLFMHKVRQFHFEIQDLFGCSAKPFSCDVEIKHADQITILPIEVERC